MTSGTGKFFAAGLMALAGLAASVLAPPALVAQVAPAPAAVYQRLAPINLAGNWVSVVTEDWEVRMLPLKKGDFVSLPLNAAGQKAGNDWDPAKEIPADACKSYAAPALLRIPGRLKINWQESGNTLRVASDAGEQTRLLHFTGTEPKGEAGWQGYSSAAWEYANGFNPATALAALTAPTPAAPAGDTGGGGRGGRRGRGPLTAPQGGALRVVTTHLKAGYLRRNGIPFSKDAVLTEYFNVYPDPFGTDWMIVTTTLHDPTYLAVDYITSTNFKREPDDSKWQPRPCSLQ